ncbi:MAG TPA: HAD family hydrolase [Holophagaceae bacterium]
MIRAVVFDLWNTLVFSPGGNPFQRMKALLRPEQTDLHAAMIRDGMTRPYGSASAFLSVWRARAGLDPVQERTLVQAFQEAGEQADWFPEVPEALGATRSLARLALLSNTQDFSLDLLDRLGVSERVRLRFLSADLGALKPEPGAFEAVQRHLGLFPGNLAMVGDSWSDDVEGALAAGWTAVWVNREGNPRPDHDPDLPLYEVRSLDRVPELIESLQAGHRCPTCLG